ncbi:3139_t:CDS:10, partial [Ambispora leptoticha]
MKILAGLLNRGWKWLNRPAWNYYPLSTKTPPSLISICGLKLAKTPKRIILLFVVSLVTILILAYNIFSSSEIEYSKVFDGDGTCDLPSWKNITQDHTVIDIIPGRTFISIQYDPLTGGQLINVDCKIPFEYHFPSMHSIFSSKFKLWDQSIDGLLKFEEEYVLIKCGSESNFLTREPILKEQQSIEPNSPLPDHSILHNQSPLADDVVFLLLDAVSREHFNEEFPKTVNFLKNMQQYTNNTHETFSFNRYNVLGLNSPPNKAFLYSGQSRDYLNWNKGSAKATWLWELFEDQGFVTMHSDGECGDWWEWPFTGYADGAITYYYQKVRGHLPAQHQFPHVSICDVYKLSKDKEFGRTCRLQHDMDSQYESNTIAGMIVNSRFCMGQKAGYEVQFDYLRQFLDVYKGLDENEEYYKRFATVTLMDTHSPEKKIKSLDDSMVKLLTDLLIGGESGEKPLLHPNSVVVILSDHGIHYGSEFASYEGYFHHKQPPLHMILPKTIADLHRPGFLINKDKLTTHMDLHMTLLYLAFGQSENMNPLSTAAALKEASNFFPGGADEKTNAQKYGDILLLPINATRTCQSIGIPPEFCPCVKFTQLNNNLTDDAIIIQRFLELAVDTMNMHIDTLQVGKVCQKFDFHPTIANSSTTKEFEYGDVAFYSGYYLPASKKESQVYSMVANIKTFLAKVKFTAAYDDIMNGRKNKVDVTQITSYKDEWEGICRGRIRDEVEDGDNKVAKGESLLKHFSEASLAAAQNEQPNFVVAILRLVAAEGADQVVRHASALYFKNYIKRNWVPEDEDSNRLSDENREWIKANIIDVLIGIPNYLQLPLIDSVTIIAENDFPHQWKNLMQQLISKFNAENFAQNNAVLETLHSIFKRYRYEFRSDELYTQINSVLDQICEPYFQLFKATDLLITQHANDVSILRVLAQTFLLLSKIFYDLNCQDLPPFFEDNINEFMDVFHNYLTYSNPLLESQDEDEIGPLEKIRSSICEIVSLYTGKYEDTFTMLPKFVQTIWTLLTSTSLQQKYDILVSKAMGFLTTVVRLERYRPLFQSEETLQQFCERIILPNMSLRESDEELFSEDPIEYIRRDLEGSDSDTRRRAATDFVRGLMILYLQPITQIINNYIGAYLQRYKENPSLWRDKDTAIYLLTSIAAQGAATKHGVTQVNMLLDVVDWFSKNVLPDFQTPVDSEPAILKVDAIKYLYTFRNQMSKEQLVSVLPALIKHLSSTNYVVYTYAAIAIERILCMRKENVILFTPVDIEEYVQTILVSLFRLIEAGTTPETLAENDYLMKAIMRVIFVSRERISNLAPEVIDHLSRILNQISKNPSNPRFNHYVFESIGGLVRFCCQNNLALVTQFENILFPPFDQILRQEVTEFIPYVFQILSQLLECHTEHDLPQMYRDMLPAILMPNIWSSS